MGTVVLSVHRSVPKAWGRSQLLYDDVGSEVRLFICVSGVGRWRKEACLYSINLLIKMSIKPVFELLYLLQEINL